jgi:hypothetical protein
MKLNRDFFECLKSWRAGIEQFLKTQLGPIDRETPILDIGLGDSSHVIWGMGFKNLQILDKSNHHQEKEKVPFPFLLGDILKPETLTSLPKFKVITFCECLEHIEKPFDAAQNVLNLLTDDGILLVTVPCLLHNHAGLPYYGDYWRFMPSGLTALFSSAQVVESTYPAHDKSFPYGCCAVVRKK